MKYQAYIHQHFIRENYSALYNWLNGPIFREIKMAKPVSFSGCGLRAGRVMVS